MKIPVLATLATILLTTSGEEITLRHQAEREITRHFSYSTELVLDEMLMSVDGEEMPSPGEMEQEMTQSLEIVVRDVIAEVDEDHALRFTRTYEKLAGEGSFFMTDPMGGEHNEDHAETSDLEGKSVLFEADGDDYTASFAAEDAGDDELLEDLVATLDLEGFLPPGPVEEGDEWKVDVDVLLALETPGGDVHLRPEEGEFGGIMDHGADMLDEEATDVEGEIVAKFVGMREEDGVRLAAIELSVDVTTISDMTEAMQAMEDDVPDDVPEGMVMPDIESFEEERHHETQTISMVISFGDQEESMEQVQSMSGIEEYEVRFDL